jgi:hypothetical protein
MKPGDAPVAPEDDEHGAPLAKLFRELEEEQTAPELQETPEINPPPPAA